MINPKSVIRLLRVNETIITLMTDLGWKAPVTRSLLLLSAVSFTAISR